MPCGESQKVQRPRLANGGSSVLCENASSVFIAYEQVEEVPGVGRQTSGDEPICDSAVEVTLWRSRQWSMPQSELSKKLLQRWTKCLSYCAMRVGNFHPQVKLTNCLVLVTYLLSSSKWKENVGWGNCMSTTKVWNLLSIFCCFWS